VLVRHVAFASEYDVEVRVGKVKGRGCIAEVMDETTSDRLGDDTGRRGNRRCKTSLQAYRTIIENAIQAQYFYLRG